MAPQPNPVVLVSGIARAVDVVDVTNKQTGEIAKAARVQILTSDAHGGGFCTVYVPVEHYRDGQGAVPASTPSEVHWWCRTYIGTASFGEGESARSWKEQRFVFVAAQEALVAPALTAV